MSKVFICAEAGVNHLGDRAKMLALCDAAKAAGADAVKFQAYDTYRLMERRHQLEPSGPTEFDWGGHLTPMSEHMDTFHLLKKAELSDKHLDAIAAHCKSIGIKWFASVFDPGQIERVLSRGACALKIGHAEAGYGELVGAVCEAGKDSGVPVWISGVNVYGVWKYPAECGPDWAMFTAPGVGGFSSHWRDWRVPAEAGRRGAKYLEVHLALSDADPEAAWSLRADELAVMVEDIKCHESRM